ncbi:MAG: RHS repeat-associated core domain-containing protein [Ignavibacteria bacterium]|nr:RHS repeat-associated core domain-containing protein [Ignavibacteria bacterium]
MMEPVPIGFSRIGNEWGNLTAQTGNAEWLNYDFTFAGGLYDPDTKLVRFGARDYDPEIGRWLDKEPLGFAGSNNFYSYCYNDPINYNDPTGLIPWLNDVRDFTAGLINNLSFGLSDYALDGIDYLIEKGFDIKGAGDRNPCNGAYTAGEWTGTALGIAAGGKGIVNAFSKKGVTVIGHLPDYVDVAKNMGANYLKPSTSRNWVRQGDFIKSVIKSGDDVFIGTNIRSGASVLKKEIKQLVKAGYEPLYQGSSWLIKTH